MFKCDVVIEQIERVDRGWEGEYFLGALGKTADDVINSTVIMVLM